MTPATIPAERRRVFEGTLLLNKMAGDHLEFDSLLPGSLANLDPILTWLMSRGLVDFSEKHFYRVSAKGHDAVLESRLRYQKIIQYFDVFSAVDLESGEFAFEHFDEFKLESRWKQYLNEDHWEDLRLPVAEYLGADPVEIVFDHFVSEGRFSFQEAGWEISLTDGKMWTKIEGIIACSLKVTDLGYDDVSGSDVIADVIEQGFLLARELSGEEPALMTHLARWAPSRQAGNAALDSSSKPFWKTRWTLDLADSE